MSKMIRMRDSLIKNVDKSEFREFIDETILEIRFRFKELNIDFSKIINSTIDFIASENIIKFTDRLIERNITKTRSETIRFLLFMYLLNGKNKKVDINLVIGKLKLIGSVKNE